jgi:hypothetical protein
MMRARHPPRKVFLALAACLADGIPAPLDLALIRGGRITPISLLRCGELAFSGLDQLVIPVH